MEYLANGTLGIRGVAINATKQKAGRTVMCTAISFKTNDHYFGRNLDLDISYNEMVTITPRNFHFRFRKAQDMSNHYALIDLAAVADHYPLYYDAANEKGLSMAGLNFPGNAHFHPEDPDKNNIAPFEFIPWILGQCETVEEAKMLLSKLNLTDIPLAKSFRTRRFIGWLPTSSNRSSSNQ